LLRADGSRKPSYGALHDLIKGEWWLPPTEMRTSSTGTVTVRGFFGDYAAGGQPFGIRRDRTEATVTLPA
jgi:endo-1,4-beta-xylanase